MTFRLANVGGRAVLLDGDNFHDLEAATDGVFSSDPMEAIANHGGLHAVSAGLGELQPVGVLSEVVVGPPVPHPTKAFGIGVNYRSHAEESNSELPKNPLTFAKFVNCISGPTDDIIVRGDAVDFEIELVVVIGERCRDVSKSDGWSRIAGITCGQDISDRRVQFHAKPPQFALGKSYDTYGPIGPVLVSVDSFEDPDDIGIQCDVWGERRQDARTSDLIFDVPEIVEYLSSICTMEPGDLIFTGTPSGVGAADRRFLKAGDTVTSSVEGVGTMTNRCVSPK